LFKELDINRQGYLEWDDFVMYCSDQVENASKLRPRDGPGSTSHMYLMEQVKKEKLCEFHQFKLCESIND
jgi:hypothetical protein